jgi:Ca2+-binding RTX toxin-like protein
LSGFENLTGSAWDDILTGSSAPNVLTGLDGNDTLNGGSSADTLLGGAGNDVLVGGAGEDLMTGGLGVDRFVLNAVAESGPGAPDVITDFVHGIDLIDLTTIDAATGGGVNNGNQAFGFGGQNSNAVAHSITWFESNGNTFVQADVNGNSAADVVIVLSGTNLHLTSSDFLL